MHLVGGMLNQDNYNAAHALGNKLEATIKQLAKDTEMDENELVLYQGSCHNHLHNMWMNQVELFLVKELEDLQLFLPTCMLLAD
jgi:hypothetical protein